MKTRRFIPEWWLDVNVETVDFMLLIADMMGFETAYPILITGEVDQ